jgi:DNA-binding IclR family transcriptional regulator
MPGHEPPRDQVAVLHKALDLLQSLAEAPLSAAEISKQIGMAKPTVYRIIRTLQSRGFVARERDGSRLRTRFHISLRRPITGTALYGQARC